MGMKRKRFNDRQIVSILKEADAGNKTVVDLCREYGISEATYYAWQRKFGQLSEAEIKRLRDLEKDNVRLKRLVAQRTLEASVLKEFLHIK